MLKFAFSYWGLVLLYLLAGANHFIHPQFYIDVIPPWLPYKPTLNYLAGAAELLVSVLLVFRTTRVLASHVIVFMLVAFIPVHVFMLAKVNCGNKAFCNNLILPWLRLFVVHPLLIAWPILLSRRW